MTTRLAQKATPWKPNQGALENVKAQVGDGEEVLGVGQVEGDVDDREGWEVVAGGFDEGCLRGDLSVFWYV